jgi:hypothetical protein
MVFSLSRYDVLGGEIAGEYLGAFCKFTGRTGNP